MRWGRRGLWANSRHGASCELLMRRSRTAAFPPFRSFTSPAKDVSAFGEVFLCDVGKTALLSHILAIPFDFMRRRFAVADDAVRAGRVRPQDAILLSTGHASCDAAIGHPPPHSCRTSRRRCPDAVGCPGY